MKRSRKLVSLLIAVLFMFSIAAPAFGADPVVFNAKDKKAYSRDQILANFDEILNALSTGHIYEKRGNVYINYLKYRQDIMQAVGGDWSDTSKVIAAAQAAATNTANHADATVKEELDKLTPVADQLEVVSVSAINAKEITVTFNMPVDKTTAETATNYVVPGKLVTAALQADKKTVLLTTNTAMTLNVATKVNVKNVKNEAGTLTVTAQDYAFTPVDEAIPSVVGVTVVSPTKISVEFSEPINVVPAPAQYALDPATTNIAPAAVVAKATNTAVAGYKIYELTFAAPITVGTHTLKINANNAIVDFAGFILPATEKTITVEADTLAPKVDSVTVISRSEIQVKFNKAIDEATLVGTKFFWNTTGNAANATNVCDAVVLTDIAKKNKVDETTYKIFFTANPLQVGSIYIFNAPAASAIKDVTGNVFPQKAFSVTVADDPAPALVGATAQSDKIIEITFNKAMNDTAANGLLDKTKYVFKNSAGAVPNSTDFNADGTLKLAGPVLTPSADKKTVTLVLSAALPADTYTITIKAGMKDGVGAAITEQSTTFTPVDTTPVAPGPSLAARTYTDATNVYFIVTFPEAMATSGNYSVLDATKWLFNTNAIRADVVAPNTALRTLPSATLTASADAKTVTIKAPKASWTDNNYYAFGLSNFADKSGNIQTSLAYTPIGASSVQVSTTESTGMDISAGQNLVANSVKVTGLRTIEFKLNKGILTIDPSDFIVNEGTNAYTTATSATKMITDVSYVNTATGSTVTVTMNKDLDLTKAITVATANPPTTNLNSIDADGLPFAKGKTTTTATVSAQPKILSASLTSATTVSIQLDQLVGVANKDDFIVEVDGKAVALSGIAKDANYITLTIPTQLLSATPVVKTVAQELIQTEGANATKLTANTTGITAKNVRVSGIALANGEATNSTTAAVSDKITLTFTDAINPLTLGFATSNKNPDGSYTKTDIAMSTDINVDGGSNDIITIDGVGTITLAQNATGDAINAKSETPGKVTLNLSADGKTLTMTITALPQAAGGNNVVITNANFDSAELTIAATIKDVNGNLINTGFKPLTGSKF